MTTQVYEVGKAYLATGLLWQVEKTSGPKNAKAAVKQILAQGYESHDDSSGSYAKEIPVDSHIVRSIDDYVQVGFANLGKLAGKAISLAAAVDQLYQAEGNLNWAVLGKLAEGQYWFASSMGGVITPDSDLVGSKEVILTAFSKASVKTKLNVAVYADADFFIEGAQPFDFDDVVAKIKGKIARLSVIKSKSVRVGPAPFLVIGALILAAGGYGAYDWYQQKLQAEQFEIDQENMRKAAEQRRLAAMRSKPPVRVEKGFISAADFIDGCLSTQPQGVIDAGGWKSEEVVCDNAGLKAVFTRKDQIATVGNLLAVIPQAQVELSGDRATLSYKINFKKSDQRVDVVPKAVMLERLINPLQLLGMKVKVDQTREPPPPPPRQGEKNQPVPPVPSKNKQHFSISGDGYVGNLRPVLSAIPGLTILSIKMNDLSKIEIEGDVNVQP